MEWLQKMKWTPLNILKALGLLVIALIIISFVLSLLGPVAQFGISKNSVPTRAPSYETGGHATDSYYAEDGDYETTLSARNIGIPEPTPDSPVGTDAEDYEVTQYSASIETRDSDSMCEEIGKLKQDEGIIFEDASESNNSCNYTFKVVRAQAPQVLSVIEGFNPKELTESTYTIKQRLDDFTSETEILRKKLETIESTLEDAALAYDEITQLARATGDASSLAEVIDSKINTIERLTQQRINTVAQLERLERSKAQQLDKLEYTYFSVYVYENKFVDGEQLKDSWKYSVKRFVTDMNTTAQDITVNLVVLLFMVLQYILYFFILLFIAKYVWEGAKGVWNK